MTPTTRASWDAQHGNRPYVGQNRRRDVLAATLERNPANPAARATAEALRNGEPVDVDYAQVWGLVPGVKRGRRYLIAPDGSVTELG